jgi:DNA-binding NtrC family response regulator
MALILIVDDEKDACQLMQRILSAHGHQIAAFTDAGEAVEWLSAYSPDLALLDIKLRGANGISVLEYIRQNRQSTKVIMITGYPSVETASKALKLGIEDYMVKPIEIDELEDHVNRVLGLIL